VDTTIVGLDESVSGAGQGRRGTWAARETLLSPTTSGSGRADEGDACDWATTTVDEYSAKTDPSLEG